MSGRILGPILIVVGVALLIFARWRIAQVAKIRDKEDFDDAVYGPAGNVPEVAILLGGLAILSGFLLWT